MAVDILRRAHQLGLQAYGVSFHVGSQQVDLSAWDRALSDAATVFKRLEQEGISLRLVNMGAVFQRVI